MGKVLTNIGHIEEKRYRHDYLEYSPIGIV